MIRTILAFLLTACVVPAGVRAQWTKTHVSGNPNALIEHLCTNGSDVYATCNDTVFWSPDNGVTWSDISRTLSGSYAQAITTSGHILIVATDSTFANTTNNGATWTTYKSPLEYVRTIAVHNDTLYAGAALGVFFSTDLGATWAVKGAYMGNEMVYALAFIGTDIFAGTHTNISRLSPGSTNWVSVSDAYFTGYECDHFALQGNTLFAACTGSSNISIGVFYKTTDNGHTWTNTDNGKLNEPLYTVVAAGTDLLAAMWMGVVQSADGGASWVPSFDLNPPFVDVMAANDQFVFAGDGAGNVWRRSLATMAGVNNPTTASDPILLSPNPASGLLTIQNLPEGTLHVVIETTLGVRVIASEGFGPTLRLDLSTLPRGSYFVRIGTPHGTMVRRIVKE